MEGIRVKGRLNWLLVTVVVGVLVFLLTPLWPMPPTAPRPPGNLLPLFVLLILVESIAFGLGVAFLVFGLPPLRRMGRPAGLTTAAYVAIAFLLVNWWPHDSLHRLNGSNWSGLVLIEYGFHVPLILAGAVLAWFFISVARPASDSG
jgi:hypothetical protein